MGKLPASGGRYIRKEDGTLEQVEFPTKPREGVGLVARSDAAEDVLAALQERLKVSTDQGIADALGIGRSTVTSWRRRGSVPRRYARLVEHDTQSRLGATFRYDLLSDEERAALRLAMMRMHHGFMRDVGASYQEFLRRGGFIPQQIVSHMEGALVDLLARMEADGFDDANQCVNAMVFEEFYS